MRPANPRLPFGAAAAALILAGASLASRADTGPCGTDTGGPLPDLVVNAAKLAQYLSVSEEKYAPTSCAVQEGFVSTPGWHTLMRFAASTPNIGSGALVIGAPQNCPALFDTSSCHGHLHYKKYTDYRLWTPGGYDTWVASRDLGQPVSAPVNAAVLAQATKARSLVAGRKMGYCMMDSEVYSPTANPTPTYIACNISQGLSVGWADTYGAFLDGQYLEVDNLKSGDYVLEVHVNPDHLLAEANKLNNSTAVKVRYTVRKGSVPASIEVLAP